MKANIGCADRLIRFIVGAAILGVGYYYRNWWGLVGVLPLTTAFVRFCPAYVPLGINTCGTKADTQAPPPS